MKEGRPAFFERIELQHALLYDQDIQDERLKIFSLEDFNNQPHETFTELVEFLQFKLTFKQKITLFFRILRNKVNPLIVPCNPTERDWDVYSAFSLGGSNKLCERLKYLKQLKKNEEIISCQM